MLHTIKYGLSNSILALLTLFTLLFIACEKDEVNVDTVQLEVFGPSPVLRGGEIRFIGNNLDKVTAVVLTGGLEITEIQRLGKEEIRIQIPQIGRASCRERV